MIWIIGEPEGLKSVLGHINPFKCSLSGSVIKKYPLGGDIIILDQQAQLIGIKYLYYYNIINLVNIDLKI